MTTPNPIISAIIAIGFAAIVTAAAHTESNHVPVLHLVDGSDDYFHLTAYPWSPTGLGKTDVLDTVERLCRFAVQHQDKSGAFIDPILEREFQYATPYLAHAIGVLIHEGRAKDLLPAGIRAMDHATASLAAGNRAIPDQHGEFYVAPLTQGLTLYAGHVDDRTLSRWRERLRTPIERIIESLQSKTNNWRTYAMKGEWLRSEAGLVSKDRATAFVEDGWWRRTQRSRVLATTYHLYQDWNGDPQSHAVEAVGRGNLLHVATAGYDGPSIDEMDLAARTATKISLLLQDPTGQCPPNGRTDNHVFNDVVYALAFATMAHKERALGNDGTAGVYKHAALLGVASIDRWWRTDDPWKGSFSITKNFFDPRDRVGYQPASQYSNYTGAVMYHLAELAHMLDDDAQERPAPNEIGGYAVVNDTAFGSAVLNAGGMQLVVNLRGDSVPKYGKYWTPLGIVRLSRTGWSSPFGLYDGEHDAESGRAITLAPTWPTGDSWVRLAERPRDYRGTIVADTTHPLLVRARALFASVTGVGGPSFAMDLTVVPDGMLVSVTSANIDEFGLTLPVLFDNGRDHAQVDIGARTIHVATAGNSGDRPVLRYVLVEGKRIVEDGEPVQSTYGWLRSYRATAADGRVSVFIHLDHESDESARYDPTNVSLTADGFDAPFALVRDATYVGKHAAGGIGDRLDLDRDGEAELIFDSECAFIAELHDGAIVRLEADRPVTARIDNENLALERFVPRLVAP